MFTLPEIDEASLVSRPHNQFRLRENPALSYRSAIGDASDACGNRLIQADNLGAMQALLPEFGQRIQCIYIDPPYNTGNVFAHYADDAEHSQWLNAMQDRLMLMRDLLQARGIIFVSIGDDEAAYLKVLMDSIFGRQNYCGTLVWEKKKKPSFLNRHLGTVTEFILAYAKNRALAGPFTYGQTTLNKRYPINNKGNGIRTLRFAAGRVQFGCPDGYYPPQDMSSDNIVCRLLDGVDVQNGRNAADFQMEGEWRYSQETLDALIANNEPLQISKVPFRPNHIKPGGEPKKLKNLISPIHYQMSTYEDATEESRALFGTAAFDYPKPEKLIHLLLNAVTQPGDWVLDAFAGSGTTGAVAQKMGRPWIMIEQGNHCQSHIVPRMQKVLEGTDPGGVSPLVQWRGGGGFRYFESV